jgi:hypothetical protein
LVLAIALGLLSFNSLSARSLGADESCKKDAQRVEIANAILCIPSGNQRYQYRLDGFFGLQFYPQAFVSDQRVPPNSYYDAAGNAPLGGTYVYASIKHPLNGGQIEAQRQIRLIQDLNDAFRVRSSESVFSENIGGRAFEFRRRDSATFVGTSAPQTLDQRTREIWVRLDATNQTRHTMICDYGRSDHFLDCVSHFIVGNSVGVIQLFGGTAERSLRISEKIRGDVESFIVSNH